MTEYTSAVFSAQVRIGAGHEFNGSEPTEMRLMVDTRNHFTVLLDNTCTECINTNKYAINENATKLNDLTLNKVPILNSDILNRLDTSP